MSRIKTVLANILIGIPGGALIFMGMLMFQALLTPGTPGNGWSMLALLCLTAFITGLLARLVRPIHGLGAAVAAGVVAALIILYLWRTATPGSETGVVFGPAGMLAAVSCSSLGGWMLPLLRKRKT